MGYRFLKFALFACLLIAARASHAVTESKMVLVRDITTISGVRDNPLVGYSLVVGLNGT
jgi:flagellar P-ring protein precursor FlgI